MSKINFTPEPFQPHPLMQNAHVQTLAGEYYRKLSSEPAFRRVRLTTPDDDFLDIDFVDVEGHTWEKLGDDAPILYFLHGLEGNARRGYAIDLYKPAAQAGYRCVGINYRSCSGEMNIKPRFYHMGATEDVHFVLEYLLDHFPNAPIMMVGASLGGNILLKYLGEQGANLSERIIAGAAISPVFIATGTQKISDDRFGKLYGGHLLKKLQVKVRLKAQMLADTPADPYRALKAKTIREFDDAITAPLNGFTSAHDYYSKSNSINFLDTIERPTLLMRSEDDPFFNRDIPYDVIAKNDWLVPAFTAHGGHVGFLEGTTPFNYSNWAQRQIINFFNTVLDQQ
ncbi:MAG: alpha/beta fold hydrolase [Phototrophicaceae bacterium]